MHFVLIDDVLTHNDILEAKLTALCRKHGWEGRVVLKTSDPQDVVDYATSDPQATVYFMDIRLSEHEDTLSLFKQIQTNGHESYLVYVSAHPQYAMACLHTHAFDFLLKPLMDEQLEDCMTAVMRAHLRRSAEDSLQISMGGRLLMLRKEDILCFTRERMNARVLCADGSTYVWRESFDHLLPRLQPGSFVQCHRSHIVNVRHIQQVQWTEDKLILSGGQELPISRRRASALRAAMQEAAK